MEKSKRELGIKNSQMEAEGKWVAILKRVVGGVSLIAKERFEQFKKEGREAGKWPRGSIPGPSWAVLG